MTNLNLPEAEIKRAVLGRAQTRILVADGSKAGARHLGLIGNLTEFDVVVTDTVGGHALADTVARAQTQTETKIRMEVVTA